MWRARRNFLRARDWSLAEGRSQSARGAGPRGPRFEAGGQGRRARTRGCAAGQPSGGASMPRSRAAGPPSPPLLLQLLLLLSPAAALHPDELFPYGESRGDQLLPEGDDESSAPVQLALSLRFLDARFGSLYVSSAAPGAAASWGSGSGPTAEPCLQTGKSPQAPLPSQGPGFAGPRVGRKPCPAARSESHSWPRPRPGKRQAGFAVRAARRLCTSSRRGAVSPGALGWFGE